MKKYVLMDLDNPGMYIVYMASYRYIRTVSNVGNGKVFEFKNDDEALGYCRAMKELGVGNYKPEAV